MDDLSFVKEAIDILVVGNVMTRGMPAVEAMLEAGLSFISGPEWLAKYVLAGRWVIAVSGTHGKTTTSSMLAWILEEANLAPSFLIGGIPENFAYSAHFNPDSAFVVVEADEYDCAFFDKRAKLVHYRPRTWIINNCEFDHADIYDDLAQIQRQFHHGLRLLPPSGLLITPKSDANVQAIITMGLWSDHETVSAQADAGDQWSWQLLNPTANAFEVFWAGQKVGEVHWSLIGAFNVHNAVSAIASARHAGIPPAIACDALNRFLGVKRRLTQHPQAEFTLYEDFAHHPTAIKATLSALRAKHTAQRLITIIEPRSNSMRAGAFKDQLAEAVSTADRVFFYRDPNWTWDIPLDTFSQPVQIALSYDDLYRDLCAKLTPQDVVVCMSNGSFGGLVQRLAHTPLQSLGFNEESV
jgi:UDP-N-acetylmuramate: L-alanyl-gamma-D-glutamyl-meso-diaminopimelate ligase